MNVQKTKLDGCLILEPVVYTDSRGYFFESFNEVAFEKLTGVTDRFIQDNQSSSVYGVIRGLHFQKGAYSQAKLVRVIEGSILDIAVDLRPGSATYREWIAVELSSAQNNQLYVPRGFAHGFSVLSQHAVIAYKCDNLYNKESESGICYNDPLLNIDWRIPEDKRILSEKDMELPFLSM